MFHENVKFYFEVIYPIEADYITRQIFLFCGITHMSFWERIIAYPNDGHGPFQLSLTLWLKLLVTPLSVEPALESEC